MRRDVQEIVKMTPQEKQVMMFSATLPRDLRVVCKKFMQDVRFSGASSNKHIHLYNIRFDGMSSEYQMVADGDKSCRCALNPRQKNHAKSFALSKSVFVGAIAMASP